MNQQAFPYEDIVSLARHISPNHAPMPGRERAAQFSPFAALTGHEDAVVEAARITSRRIELDEGRKLQLSRQLEFLSRHLQCSPEVSISHFVRDSKKAGGSYVTARGLIKKIDEYSGRIIMANGLAIDMENIYSIDSDILDSLE